MFRCPMCQTEFESREDFRAHIRRSDECRRTALGILEMAGIPEDRARAGLGLDEDRSSDDADLNEFGDRMRYSEAVTGIGLLLMLLALAGLAVARLAGWLA